MATRANEGKDETTLDYDDKGALRDKKHTT